MFMCCIYHGALKRKIINWQYQAIQRDYRNNIKTARGMVFCFRAKTSVSQGGKDSMLDCWDIHFNQFHRIII